MSHTTKPLNLNDVEMVFGTPTSPKTAPSKPDVQVVNETNHGKDNTTNKYANEAETTHPAQPLLEPDKEHPTPPLAGPEIDDLGDDHHPTTTPYPGIDDGLLEPNNNSNHKPEGPGEDGENLGDEGHHEVNGPDDGVGTDDGKLWPWKSHDEADYPYDGINGLSPRFGEDDRPGSPMMPPGTIIPDMNTYQQKKNLAQGMMDLALLSANANQLRYVLESSVFHPYFYPSVVFISLSIILQIAVGVGLIMNSRYNVTNDKDICKADKINNMTVLGIFLITIVNVFITSFSVATPTTTAALAASPAGRIVQAEG